MSSRPKLNYRGSAEEPRSRNTSVSRLPQELDSEALKLRSYKEQVFVSDDEDYVEQEGEGAKETPAKSQKHRNASRPLAQAVLYNRRHTPSLDNSTGSGVTHSAHNSIQGRNHCQTQSEGQNQGHGQNQKEDEEDELMFAMSDMTLAKNNFDF